MKPGFVKKGALVLAFAAALSGCGPGGSEQSSAFIPPDPDRAAKQEYAEQELKNQPEQRAAELQGRNAADWQVNLFQAKAWLDSGKMTQEKYDAKAKEYTDFIASRRNVYVSTPWLAAFDAAFEAEVTRRGYTPPKFEPQPTAEQVARIAPAAGPKESILPAVVALANALMTDNSIVIGPNAQDPALKGTTVQAPVFTGGPVQNNTTISGDALKANQSYVYEGRLTINGDVPPGVALNIRNGELLVNGNVGEGVRINVHQPEKMINPGTTHKEKYPCYNYDDAPSRERPSDYSYHYGYRQNGCEKDVPDPPRADGLLYKNDPDPAVRITGTVGLDVQVTTNGGKKTVENKAAPQEKPATRPAAPKQ